MISVYTWWLSQTKAISHIGQIGSNIIFRFLFEACATLAISFSEYGTVTYVIIEDRAIWAVGSEEAGASPPLRFTCFRQQSQQCKGFPMSCKNSFQRGLRGRLIGP